MAKPDPLKALHYSVHPIDRPIWGAFVCHDFRPKSVQKNAKHTFERTRVDCRLCLRLTQRSIYELLGKH